MSESDVLQDDGSEYIGTHLNKQISRNRFLKISAAAIGSAFIAACGGQSGGTSKNGTKTLRIMWPSGNAPQAVEAVREEFASHFGYSFSIDVLPYDTQKQKAFTELASKSSYYDIIMVDAPWGPALAGDLVPMSGYLQSTKFKSQADITDFVPKVFFDTCVLNPEATHLHYPGNTIDINAIVRQGHDLQLP